MSQPQNKSVIFKDLGLIDYQQAWDYQQELFRQIVDQKVINRDLPENDQKTTENYLIACEHPNVYTLGNSGKEENLLISGKELVSKQAAFYKINRGGDITYHGPGQVVIYPILDLDNFFTDIHKYLRYLEEAVIQTLAEFGIASGRIEGLTGVWIGAGTPNPRKICALGVRSSRWVVMHGLAVNINTDLSYFGNIVPCGITDKAVTSLQTELGVQQNMEQVKQILLNKITEVFGMELIFGLSTSNI
jgi:lipoyl(octanoyl) transferase